MRIEDVPDIWRGGRRPSTAEACGDVPRVILGSPVAGIASDEIIDGTPAVREIIERYIGSEEFSNLPRKFKTAISGSPRQDVAHEIHDIAFQGVVHPEHGPGFDLWVGGGLSTNPMLGQRLGAWVPLDEIPDVWKGVISIFRDYGYRRLRNRARLKFLVADWGVEKFREVLETEYLKRRDRRTGTRAAAPGPVTTSACTRRRTASSTSASAPTVGPGLRSKLVTKLADLMEAARRRERIRLTTDQGIVLILDVDDGPGGRRWSPRWTELGLSVTPVARSVATRWRAPARVLQARHRRDQGPRHRDWSRSSSGASATWTCR